MDVLTDFQDILVYLSVSQTTKQTVLSLSEYAVLCPGVPSRIRRIKGGESILLWKKMLELMRGPNGGNYLPWSSVITQTFEWLLKDVWILLVGFLYKSVKTPRQIT